MTAVPRVLQLLITISVFHYSLITQITLWPKKKKIRNTEWNILLIQNERYTSIP